MSSKPARATTLPDNVISIVPCEVCNDQGVVVDRTLERGDPLYLRPQPCPANCRVVANRRRRTLNNALRYTSQQGGEYERMTFEGFLEVTSGIQFGKMQAYGAAQAWAMMADRDVKFSYQDILAYSTTGRTSDNAKLANWVVLYGAKGKGKTGLAWAAWNVLQQAGRVACVVRTQDFYEAIKRTYNDKNDHEAQDIIQRVASFDFLILDELTAPYGRDGMVAPDRCDRIEQLLRTRDAQRLPTLITTNWGKDECYQRWGQQISGSLDTAHWIPMGGENLRTLGEVEDEEVW